ncbi:MAG: DEAD/DEAH box helicase [Deltaproteobacteria bacterium]|nr:DEAD/DEAH box helicase [Deltaproteobacteria bacterium]
MTPTGALVFTGLEGDWRELLFNLGAQRVQSELPVVRFFRTFSELFVAALCRLPVDLKPSDMAPPPLSQLEELSLGAPPMSGGEYLSPQSLETIWRHLVSWTESQVKGTVSDFLAERAPKWRRVGRVVFHLAENKADPLRPFAFLATYVTSLTVGGRDSHILLKKAVQKYYEENNRSALVNLLTPVSAAAEKLKWVADLYENNPNFEPTTLTIAEAHQFLLDQPVLAESGLMVLIPDWWRKMPRVKVSVTVGERKTSYMGLKTILDWNVGLSIDGNNLTDEEVQEILRILNKGAEGGLIFFKGRWLEVDKEKLTEALDNWLRAKEASQASGLTFIQAMRMLSGIPGPEAEKENLPEPSPWMVALPGDSLAEILKQLKDPEAAAPPANLKADLRPYQKKGLAWLKLLRDLGLGACLADDMGLGKTIQVLALLLLEKKKNPSQDSALLICPASLMANWKAEAEKFTPSLNLKIFHPSESSKEKMAKWQKNPQSLLKDCDLVVASYGMVSKNLAFFEKTQWPLIILDEAQAIKNPNTAQSRAVKKIQSATRIALTGTPIENRLTDMWSIFDFLNPGLLGSLKKFQSVVSRLESEEGDHYAPLRRLVSPYLLRRLKTDRRIISELPDKTETTFYCNLTAVQAKLYASEVHKLEEGLDDMEDSPSNGKRRNLIFKILMGLKQLINHPAQFNGDYDWDYQKSGKFIRLKELCQEMAERQERTLVFTQFREIIDPLFRHLSSVFGAQGLVLHGGTPVSERKKLVAAFQREDGPPFFILSLRAGGTGLNLTAAGQVIHFDRWWNPAVEDQATDRAYRIGQKKNVLVHKSVTMGTIEERLDIMLRDKRELASDILSQDKDTEIDLCKMDNQTLLELVSLDIDRALM